MPRLLPDTDVSVSWFSPPSLNVPKPGGKNPSAERGGILVAFEPGANRPSVAEKDDEELFFSFLVSWVFIRFCF
jgi:hypothetical protein